MDVSGAEVSTAIGTGGAAVAVLFSCDSSFRLTRGRELSLGCSETAGLLSLSVGGSTFSFN